MVNLGVPTVSQPIYTSVGNAVYVYQTMSLYYIFQDQTNKRYLLKLFYDNELKFIGLCDVVVNNIVIIIVYRK